VQHQLKRQAAAAAVALASLLPLAAPPARAEVPAPERLRVVDPYVELRTGPGRGYPIFHVAARDEWIEITLRHTDWFKVRTASGREGWVQRRQLELTLTEAGERKSFRDVLVDDYLSRRVELGAAVGRFQGEPMLKLWTRYRLADPIGVEGTVGQVQGLYSGTDFWHVDLHAEPWSDRRLSPHLGIGVGRFHNFPNLSLVEALRTDANLALATVGVRYYLTERFVVRADYTIYTAFVSDTRSLEYRAITAGLAFFF
jgi:uncharacterized protein YraI